ncbi:MAG: hypothetical protein WKG00_41670 [Polyangiaceae bacterium]
MGAGTKKDVVMGARTAVLSRRIFHRALGALAATAVVGADRVARAHTLHACPTCRFAGFFDGFAAPVKPQTVKWIKNDLRQKWAGRGTPTPAEENELAADRYTFDKAKSEVIGQLWLVGSYLMRGATGQPVDQRKAYQRAAARFFTQALAAGEVKASNARWP